MVNDMWKKGLVLGIIVLFVGASVVPSVMSGNELKTPIGLTIGTTWYVKEGGNNSNGGTSWKDAWRDINYAINYSSVVDGDIIAVGDGTYNENVVITKQLRIVGNGSNVATIDGGGVGNVIGINASKVTIAGFTITNSGPLNGAGIYVCYNTDIFIEKNIIEKNHHGIWFYYGRSSDIEENVVQDNAWGIYIENTRDIRIYGNWVLNNSNAGIFIEDGVYIDIEFNVIKDNPGWAGLRLYDSFGNEIKENNFISNGLEDYTHIMSSNCRFKLSNNYYEPHHWINFGFLFRIYIVWGIGPWGIRCVVIDRHPAKEPYDIPDPRSQMFR